MNLVPETRVYCEHCYATLIALPGVVHVPPQKVDEAKAAHDCIVFQPMTDVGRRTLEYLKQREAA